MNKDETARMAWPGPQVKVMCVGVEEAHCARKACSNKVTSVGVNDWFYLLGYASGQVFGLGLWDHEGMRYDLENWSTKWKNETYNRKEGTNITVRAEEISKEHKLDNGEIFILTDNQVFEGWFYNGHNDSQNLNR